MILIWSTYRSMPTKTWHPVKRKMLPFRCKCNCARRRRAFFIPNKVQTPAICLDCQLQKTPIFLASIKIQFLCRYFGFINIPDVKVLVWKFWLKVLGGSRKLGLNSGSGAWFMGPGIEESLSLSVPKPEIMIRVKLYP